MKDLRASRAARLVRRLVAEGEHTTQDFKFTVNDPRKIARTVSAFANTRGGHLLIGVSDSGEPRGVRSEEDIYVVEAAAEIYSRPACHVDFTAYRMENGATVIRAEIPRAMRRPVYAVDDDGQHRAYLRVADENIAAHPLLVRAWQAVDDETYAVNFTLTPERTAILEAIRAADRTPEYVRDHCGLSNRRFEQTVIDLFVAHLLDFRYTGHSFCLVPAQND